MSRIVSVSGKVLCSGKSGPGEVLCAVNESSVSWKAAHKGNLKATLRQLSGSWKQSGLSGL